MSEAQRVNAWGAAAEDIAALLQARHADPFAILGPHRIGARTVLRALLPGAATAEVLTDDGPVALTRRDPAGFFEAMLPGAAPAPGYRLRAVNADATWEEIDPYAFASVLGALDDHLLVEGTHRRLYERLGAHVVNHEGVRRGEFRRLGAERAGGVAGRRLQFLGRPPPSDA